MQSNASNDEQLYIHNHTWKKEMHILVNATIIRNAYFKEEFSKTKKNQIRKKIKLHQSTQQIQRSS